MLSGVTRTAALVLGTSGIFEAVVGVLLDAYGTANWMSGDDGQLLRLLASVLVWCTLSPRVGAALCSLLTVWLRLRAAFAEDMGCCWSDDDGVVNVFWPEEPILEGGWPENVVAVEAAVSDFRRGASLRAEVCDGADLAELCVRGPVADRKGGGRLERYNLMRVMID